MNADRILKRSERIKMFLNEYYFGQSIITTLLRLIGGPLFIYLGLIFYDFYARFAVAYGGFLFVYGIYYTLKPLIWILFRLDSFKTVEFDLKILEDRITIKDPVSESEIFFTGIPKILKRKNYFALQLSKYNKVYLPFSILTTEQIDFLNRNLP